jgi:hypothetical protein
MLSEAMVEAHGVAEQLPDIGTALLSQFEQRFQARSGRLGKEREKAALMVVHVR